MVLYSIFGKPTVLPLETGQLTVRHLLDDSVLEEPNLATQILDLDQNSPGSPADAVNEDCSLLSKTRYGYHTLELSEILNK